MITIQDMITRFGEQEMAERSNHENYETIDEAVMAAAMPTRKKKRQATFGRRNCFLPTTPRRRF